MYMSVCSLPYVFENIPKRYPVTSRVYLSYTLCLFYVLQICIKFLFVFLTISNIKTSRGMLKRSSIQQCLCSTYLMLLVQTRKKSGKWVKGNVIRQGLFQRRCYLRVNDQTCTKINILFSVQCMYWFKMMGNLFEKCKKTTQFRHRSTRGSLFHHLIFPKDANDKKENENNITLHHLYSSCILFLIKTRCV